MKLKLAFGVGILLPVAVSALDAQSSRTSYRASDVANISRVIMPNTLEIIESRAHIERAPNGASLVRIGNPGGDVTNNPLPVLPNWVQVNEFEGSRTYVDRTSLVTTKLGAVAWVRYELHPPGTDKRNKKPISEMWLREEYDFQNTLFRLHRIILKYTDGSQDEPGIPGTAWHPATAGNRVTLDALRSIIPSASARPPRKPALVKP